MEVGAHRDAIAAEVATELGHLEAIDDERGDAGLVARVSDDVRAGDVAELTRRKRSKDRIDAKIRGLTPRR